MRIIRDVGKENWIKIVFALGLTILAMIFGRYIAAGTYLYFLVLLFSGFVLALYYKYFELFILLLFFINHEFFYLVPRPDSSTKDYQFQGLIYLTLILTGTWYFLKENSKYEIKFNKMIYAFLIIVGLGVFSSYLQGQPLILGFSVGRGYFLILFYFVFMSKEIKIQKLFNLVIITAALLTFINNIQYLFYGRLNIFYLSREAERAGQLRLMQGGFFVIFASFLALGEYLRTKKRKYLVVCIYMVFTVIVQGQTRTVFVTVFITIAIILVLAKKVNLPKAVISSVALFAVFMWILPIIQSTFLGKLYGITRYEIAMQEGGVKRRLDTYSYYWGEIMKSPVIGRGMWSSAYSGDNPEDMSHRDMYLSDIGITEFLFHCGILGAIWLILLFKKIYKLSFYNLGRLKENMHYGLIGFLIFCILMMPTINRLTHSRSIVYLALVLAILSQLNHSDQENEAV